MQRVLRSQADTLSFQHIRFAETMLRVGTPVLILIQVTFDTLRHQIRHFHPNSPPNPEDKMYYWRPGWPCEPLPASHPHRPEWHQQNHLLSALSALKVLRVKLYLAECWEWIAESWKCNFVTFFLVMKLRTLLLRVRQLGAETISILHYSQLSTSLNPYKGGIKLP